MSVKILSGRRLAITFDLFCLIIGGPSGAVWANCGRQ